MLSIDFDSFRKIDNTIDENKLRPFDAWKEMIMLLNFLIGVTFMLSGHDEHKELCWSNFKFSTVESGKFAGRRKVEIFSLLNKSCKVTITNKGCLDATEYLKNDMTCLVFWIHYYRKLCPPEQKRFYCYKASAKLIKVSNLISKFLAYSILDIFSIFFKLQKYRECNLPYMSDAERQIGKNKLSIYAPIFANRCGFNDLACQKPHGKRAVGITMISNSSSQKKLNLKTSRHVNMKMHARYQHLTAENIEKNTQQ